jgi:ATPase subunit of ABC transporter with duplicated ATPase domains
MTFNVITQFFQREPENQTRETVTTTITKDISNNQYEFAVSVEGLSHSYDGKKYVVQDVSFEVRKGEIFGLLGRNGAGKTTTIVSI